MFYRVALRRQQDTRLVRKKQVSDRNMSELDFSNHVLKTVVAQVCLAVGWTSVYPSSLELMVHLLHSFLRNLTLRSAETASHVSGGLTRQPTPEIVWSVLERSGFSFTDMKDYLDAFQSTPELKPRVVPKYPVPAIRGETDEESSDCAELSLLPDWQSHSSFCLQRLRQLPQWSQWRKRAKKFRRHVAAAQTVVIGGKDASTSY